MVDKTFSRFSTAKQILHYLESKLTRCTAIDLGPFACHVTVFISPIDHGVTEMSVELACLVILADDIAPLVRCFALSKGTRLVLLWIFLCTPLPITSRLMLCLVRWVALYARTLENSNNSGTTNLR